MKKLVKNKGLTAVLLVAAIALLVVSGIQTSRAALTYVSENYIAQVDTKNVDVTLIENGSEADGTLLSAMVPDEKMPLPGVRYADSMAVKNTGSIDSFDRVVVYKYWLDEDEKRVDLSPDLIHLEFGSDWIVDESAGTEEMCVLYYPNKLAPGETSSPFITAVTLDQSIQLMVTKVRTDVSDGWYEITNFNYNGLHFVIEVEANAVQSHNARTAIKSAWGVNAEVSGNSYSLK